MTEAKRTLTAKSTSTTDAQDKERAHESLRRLIAREPENERAWLELASVCQDPRRRRSYLRQALRLNPQNRQALDELRQLDAELAARTHQAPLPSRNSKPTVGRKQAYTLPRVAGAALLMILLVVILGGFVGQAWVSRGNGTSSPAYAPPASPTPRPTATPTVTPTPSVPERVALLVPRLERAWEDREWEKATDLLFEVARMDVSFPGLSVARCDTYLHWANDLTDQGQVKRAYELYRQAYDVCPDTTTVQQQKSRALVYLSGQWEYERARWGEAASRLREVYDADPDYANAEHLLHQAYLAWCHDLAGTHQYESAFEACEAALELRPQDAEVVSLLDEIRFVLTPTPTPIPPKRIEINISQQRMYVWEADTLLYKWVCSTGEPGRGTRAGHFQVLDKIPEAWASRWSLRMPYWLGIYFAGASENGIHALPILPSGQTLWAGYLGTPVSYGCIILSTENARTLYHWADIGTPVWIHY